MLDIYQRYLDVKERIQEIALACGRNPEEIKLITVTKTCSLNMMRQVYQMGCRDFGESRVQEALEKIPHFASDIHWHLIGTLQSNKVSHTIQHFKLIHSVDTSELAKKIAEASQKRGITTSILLQVNTSGEKTKHGLTGEEWRAKLEEIDQLSHLQLEGLMTMAPLTEDERVIRLCFSQLFSLRSEFQRRVRQPSLFRHLSMGMSHDYPFAIQEGATLLRIGTAIFENR